MTNKMTRREFASGMALTAARTLGISPRPADAEPPPETTRLRIARLPLRSRVSWRLSRLRRIFSGRRGSPTSSTGQQPITFDDLATGKIDFAGSLMIMGLLLSLDAGRPFVAIGGIHAGCFELFGTSRVRSVRDLKNGTIAVGGLAGACARDCHGHLCRLRPSPGCQARPAAVKGGDPTPRRREDRCVTGLPARPPGATDEKNRSCGGEHHERIGHGRSISAAWPTDEREVCQEAPGSHQADAARVREGDGHVCARARIGLLGLW